MPSRATAAPVPAPPDIHELGRRLQRSPHIRARIGQVKKELDHLVLDTLEETIRTIGVAAEEQSRLGRAYLESVERLGFA